MDHDAPNLLARGFYTVPEAARLIEVGSRQRIYGWLQGYPNRKVGPLLHREYEPLGGVHELSFLDLMEVRFVEYFREEGVKVRTLRNAAAEAREFLQTEHPFATDHIRFRTDRKDIFVEEILKKAAEQTHDRRLWNLVTKQYQIYEAIRESLITGVEFDPHTHLAYRWLPRPQKFPQIVIDPRIVYGRPAGPSGIPTSTLFDAWKAEREDFDAVAYWYEVPTQEVRQAVDFERALAA